MTDQQLRLEALKMASTNVRQYEIAVMAAESYYLFLKGKGIIKPKRKLQRKVK